MTPRREAAPGRSLRRLEVFLDVLYALIVFRLLGYLPPVQDTSWVGKPLGVLGPVIHNPVELWRASMGIGLAVIFWTLSNGTLSRLRATDRTHTLAILIQTALVCLLLYFAISDPTLAGGSSSRALQCGFAALASVAGEWAWGHARKHGLVDAHEPAGDLDDIGRRGRAGTATAVLTTPLSWVGTVTWTVGWVVLPVVILQLLPRLAEARARSGAGRL